MKKHIIVLLFLLIGVFSQAQQTRRQNIDTLLSQLPHIKEDTAGARVLSRLGSFYLRVDLDSAVLYLERSIELSEKLKFSFGILNSKQSLAAAYTFKGEIDRAINAYQGAFEEALVSGDTVRSMLILIELIVATREKGDSKLADEYFKMGYELAPKTNEYSDYFNARLNINRASFFHDDLLYDSAFFYWDKALKTMERIQLPGFTAVISNNMASAYFDIYDYPKALDAHKKAFEIATAMDYRPVEIDSQLGIARVYSAIDNADLAINRLLPVYEEEKQLGNPTRTIKVELELIRAYNQKKDFDNAIVIANAAYNRGKSLGLKAANISSITNNLSKLWLEKNDIDSSLFYLNISDSLALINERNFPKFSNLLLRVKLKNLEGKHMETLDYLVKADSLASMVLGPKQRAEVSYMKYLYYREIGELTNALDALERSNNLRDSLRNLEKRGDLIRLGSEIETANKQAEIEKREGEIELLTIEIEEKKSRNELLTIAFGSIAMIMVLIAVLSVRKLKSSRKLKELESEKLQDELIQKNRQLTTKALQDARKNQVLDSLLTETKIIQTSRNTDLSKLIRLAKEGINSEKKLELFTIQFEETNPNFYKNLRDLHPSLSPREEQICALVNLNFSTKEIASFLGIEASSATTARYRLRQKLGLEKEQNLIKYLQGLNEL
ncbi:tetratricopeptide repeat protein [Roseivirga misakiensis]|uniref:HTH luxR-type domain-containing protein n=1 Tax=Roseivirga misakiensis TaxID=1563681 RepID=A0A1E5T7S0_9BACT|nr:LuxR C-terminal-related transcriptional regulator [Roseivirga misakiensis]OEK07434.1 hypothetical protein BFP71_00045 [Roseivirga misakiensis]